MLKLDLNLARNKSIPEYAHLTYRDRYFAEEESSPQETFERAALAYADDISHAQRLYDYLSKGWFMQVTPMIANAPRRLKFAATWADNFKADCFESIGALPISCYLSYAPSGPAELAEHEYESSIISTLGGGIGGYWGAASAGSKKPGSKSSTGEVIPHLIVLDAVTQAAPQSGVRNAGYAAYLDVAHPDIVEFLEIRKSTGGDANRKAHYLHHGVCIPDSFMELLEKKEADAFFDDSWPLVDPVTLKVVEILTASQIWSRILEITVETGEPFVMWTDTVNRAVHQEQLRAGMRVVQSNLCSEIVLPSSPSRTAVSTLSSVNLATRDEWKNDPLFIEDVIRMLDNSIELFIHNAPAPLYKAVADAKAQRALGLGAMGFHSYLQANKLALDDPYTRVLNKGIFKDLAAKALDASIQLARERGPCSDANGTMLRNMYRLAVAPNGTSSTLLGVTPSCEPAAGNVFTHKTKSGSFVVKNPELLKLLEEKGLNTESLWLRISAARGSVAEIDELSEREKQIFLTAQEVDQFVLVDLAADRQPDICQSQSLNFFLRHNVSIAYLHDLHMYAWKRGIKTRYYIRSSPARSAEALISGVTLEAITVVPGGDVLEAKGYFKPFRYPWAYTMYKTQQEMHWMPKEAPMHEDVHDWKFKLTDGERNLLTQLFRFFTTSDVDVGAAYASKFLPKFQNEEIRMMLMSFGAMEAVHADAYSTLLETIGMPDTEYQAFKKYEAMAAKHDYLANFTLETEADVARNLAVYSAFTEGLQLFSTFAILLNFARAELPRGARMKGMCQIVSWSIRDESLHVFAMLLLFRTYIAERPYLWTKQLQEELYEICRQMVLLEDSFIDLAFELGGTDGLDTHSTKRFNRFIADRRLEGLTLKPLWGITENPLPHVDYLSSGLEHANFFETKPTEYAKASLTGSWSNVWGSSVLIRDTRVRRYTPGSFAIPLELAA